MLSDTDYSYKTYLNKYIDQPIALVELNFSSAVLSKSKFIVDKI